jgi:hypothetical protein
MKRLLTVARLADFVAPTRYELGEVLPMLDLIVDNKNFHFVTFELCHGMPVI